MEWTDRGARVFACAVVLSVIASTAVALRFIARGYILRVIGLTDWFLLLTLFFSFGNTVCVGIHVSRGLGQHNERLDLEDTKSFLQITWAAIIVGNLSMVLTKISILLLFLDIFFNTRLRKLTKAVLGVVAAYGICLTVSNVLICLPVGSFWDLTNPDRRCVSVNIKWYADAGINIALDFIIFCLPIPVVRSMTLPWRQKVWLYGVFALGFIICVISVVRLHFLYLTSVSADAPFDSVHVAYWSTVEMNIAIVIACVPTLKPLITKFCPGLLISPGTPDNEEIRQVYPPTISSPRLQQRHDPEMDVL